MKKIITILMCLVLLCSPAFVNATTISQFEAEVAKYTAELQEKQAKLAKNDAEIAQVKKNIANIESQITETENTINKLQEEIEESNRQIIKKSEESKKIMQYYQIENGDNAYLEYAFGAETITDMIYRASIVEQLTEYNDQIMKELKRLIEENKTKKAEQAKKKEELATLKKDLEKEKQRIEIDSANIRDSIPSVEERIKAAKANVTYFKNLGCGANEDIQSCAYRVRQSSSQSIPSTGATLRPTITGYREGGLGSYYGHIGQDIGSNNKTGETIYPIAGGTIFAVYQDKCSTFCAYTCNGNANIIVMIHNINNKYIYASYVHMSSINFSSGDVGRYITAYTPLGQMGSSGCTSGRDAGGTHIHLHLELSTCHWKSGGGCTYGSYTSHILNPASYVALPSTWNNR